MKVLLTKDVYKLGRAGDIKRVADGYGRNYLLPQGLALLATPGALKQAERIRAEAAKQRAILNQEMNAVAEAFKDITLTFPAKAGETGKLYGSITTQEVADALKEKTGGVEIKRQQVDMQPIRQLGEHKAHIRLTMDLIPEIDIIVYREGETDPLLEAAAEAAAQASEETPSEAVAVQEPATLAEEESPSQDVDAPAEEPVSQETESASTDLAADESTAPTEA